MPKSPITPAEPHQLQAKIRRKIRACFVDGIRKAYPLDEQSIRQDFGINGSDEETHSKLAMAKVLNLDMRRQAMDLLNAKPEPIFKIGDWDVYKDDDLF